MDGCKKIRKFLSSYLDGELVGKDKVDFEDHLEQCKDCSETTQQVQKLTKLLPKLSRPSTSPDFNEVLRARIRIENTKSRRQLKEVRWPWLDRVPLYGMSLAIIVLAVILVREQINRSHITPKPNAMVNPMWYGGKAAQNSNPNYIVESENVIYILDRISPADFLNKKQLATQSDSLVDSLNVVVKDSLKMLNKKNRVTF
jgi:hypothetical protein